MILKTVEGILLNTISRHGGKDRLIWDQKEGCLYTSRGGYLLLMQDGGTTSDLRTQISHG